MRNKIVVQDAMDFYDVQSIFQLLKGIFIFTIGVEILGAIPLFIKWLPKMGATKASYYAIFHSVSAFCNAGFSLFATNIQPFREDVTINLAISSLIILGGIGFVVHLDLWRYFKAKILKRSFFKLSLQSKVVLSTSFILILLGMLAVLSLEWNNTLQPLSSKGKILGAFFSSVTCRTAGFNTLPTRLMTFPMLLIFVLLMFIGASPGSTGGGIKTTTFTIFLDSLQSMMLDQDRVNLFNRTIPRKEIQRSIVIIGLSSLLVVLGLIAILILEGGLAKGVLPHLFEVVSAFGTVGLSTGLTPQLSPLGRLLITLIMFVGRTGPLTVALAISSSKPSFALKYPEGQIMVG